MDLPEEAITKMLERMHELVVVIEQLEAEQERLVREVVPLEIAVRLAEIEEEYGSKIEQAVKLYDSLAEEAQKKTTELGKTVTGSHFKAVYHAGRVTWDTKSMEGFAAAHPELNKLKKVGKPYVVVTLTKGTKDGSTTPS